MKKLNDVDVLRSFAVLNRAFLAHFAEELAKHRLTYSEGILLANIGHRPGTTQEALVSELLLDKGAVARAVKGLKARKLVVVKQSPDDGRAHNLHLTRAGEVVLEFIDALNAAWISRVTVDISAKEFRAFSSVLSTLVTRVRALPS